MSKFTLLQKPGLNQNVMLRNYLKIALRNLRKHRTYSLINIIGLAIGLTSCLLITVYVRSELSYDRFWTHGDRIYRVNQINRFEEEREAATVSIPVGPAIAQQLPALEAQTRLFQRSGSMATTARPGRETRLFQEPDVLFVDSTFFAVFAQPLLRGNPQTVLNVPHSVVLSERAAHKYFGTQNPVGRVVRYENRVDLTVTGVFANLPTNTDLRADFLIHFATLFTVEPPGVADFLRKDWLYNPTQTFVRLARASSIAQVEARFPALLRRSGDERVRKHVRLALQPLYDIHLYSSMLEASSSTGNIHYLILLAMIAGVIVLIACFNFINLSTAHSLQRTREVGLRKCLGAVRGQLMGQFLGEALLMSGFSFALALLLTLVFLPFLNQFTSQHFTVTDLFRADLVLVWAGIFLVTGLLAGVYPALFASGFRPVRALKGQISERIGRGFRFRQVLVVMQFSVSVMLMMAAGVVLRQLTYLRTKPLGFQKEQVITIPLFGSGASATLPQGIDGPMRSRMNTFEEAVGQSSWVRGITAASGLPGNGYIRSLVVPEGRTEQSNVFVAWVSVDYDFLSTLDIPLVAGRDFSKKTGTDHLEAFVLNESAVRSFGYKSPAAAIGRPIQRGGEGGKKGVIIGVVSDFHFDPLDQPLQPLIIDVEVPRFTTFAVRVLPDNLPQTLADLQQNWEAFFPERPFEYAFLDDTINRQYRAQAEQSQLLGVFAGLAIFISCLGLFGLVAHYTVQRTKEIGVRKVLGASITSILFLLSRNFLILVGIAIVIAALVGGWVMNRWLENFAYRIAMPWWIFALAGLVAVGIALLTVVAQSLKTALTNPVKSLRTE